MLGTDPPRQVPPRRRRLRRRLAIAAAIVLVPLLVGVAVLHTGPVRRYALERVTRILAEQGINVQADSLRFNLLALSVNLQNVTVESPATPDAPFAIIGRLSANLSLFDLIAGRYVLESARLDDLAVHYVVYEDGSDNLPRPPRDPDDPGEPIDFLIEDGRITRANVRYENRAAGVDLLLPIREALVDGTRLMDRHAIALTAGDGRLQANGRLTPIDELTADVDFGEDDVSIERLILRSGDAQAEVTGTVEDFDSPTLDVRLEAAIDARRAADLASLRDPVAGRLRVEAEATGPVDQLTIDATVEGRDLAYRDLQAFALDVEARYESASGVVTANRIGLQAPWGRVTGTAAFATRDTGQSSVELTADNVDTARLMRALDVTPIVASRADVRVDANWTGRAYRQASGDAVLSLSPAGSATKNVLPVGGRIDVTLNGGRVVADLRGLLTAGSSLEGQVTLGRDEQLGGTVRASVADVGATTAVLEAVLGREPGWLLPAKSSGALTATASLGGTTSSPTADVVFGAPAVSLAEAGTIALDGQLRFTRDALLVKTLTLAWNEARASASGRIGLATGEPISLTFQADQLELPALLAAAGQDASLASGTLSFNGSASGTFDRPQIAASLAGEGLVVRQEPLGAVAADLRLDGRQATLTELVLDKPQSGGNGRLTASGTYHLDTGAYTYAVDSTGIELTSLQLPDGRPLRGRFALSGGGEGTRDQPSGSLRVSAEALQLADHDLGNVTVDTTVRAQVADVSVTAPRFNLDATAQIGIARPYPATIDAQFASLDLSALPVDLPGPLAGTMSGTVRASGDLATPSALDVRASIRTLEGTWNGQPFTVEPANVTFADAQLVIEGLTLTARESTLSLSGTLPLANQGKTGTLTVDGQLNLATLAAWAPPDYYFSADGTVAIAGTVSGDLSRVDPRLTLELEDATIDTPRLPRALRGVTLRAAVADGVASVDELAARFGDGSFSATARMPLAFAPDLPVDLPRGDGPATVTARLTGLDPGLVPGAPVTMRGLVSATLDLEADRPDIAALAGTVTFDALEVTAEALTLAQQQTTTIRIANGVATIEQLDLNGTAGTVQARGSVGLAGDRPLDVNVDGQLELAALLAFSERVRADGTATVDFSARGTVAKPDFSGVLSLANGFLVVDEPGIYAEQLSARVELAGRRVTLADLFGTLNGGTVSGNGGFVVADGDLREVNLRLTADGVAFETPFELRSLSDATLTVTERNDLILVGGRVRIREAGLTNDLEIDQGLFERFANPPELTLTKDRNRLLDRVRFDVEVVTDTPIVVDNNLARAAVTTDLRVLGTPYETGMAGRLEVLEGGRISLNERQYAVERGMITFFDERRILPSLDLRLTTTAGRYDVTLALSGEPKDLDSTLTSNPTLPEPDIMALLVTGRTLEQMRGEEYDIAREQMLSYLAGRLGSQLGRGLERATGFSEVRLDPNLIANEADPTARLTIAQELTRALKLIFSTDLSDSSDQIWVAQYDVTRRFDATATRQADGTYRLDLRHDVRFGGRPAPQQMPRSRPVVDSLTVETDGVMSEADARALLGLEVGDEYDYFAAHKGVRDLEEALLERGHLQARVRLERTVNEASASLALRVAAGPVVTVAFEGATPPRSVLEDVQRQWSRGVFDRQRAGDATEQLRAWFIDSRHFAGKVDHRIEDTGAGMRRVVFILEPGPRFTGVERIFKGAAGVAPDVLNEIIDEQKLSQQVFTDPVAVTTLLARYYREEGFLIAEVDQPEYDFSGSMARVVIPVREGPKFAVGNITVNGNTVIDDAALVRDLPLVTGDPYLPRTAALSLDRIRDVYWDRAYNEVRSEYSLTTDERTGRVDVAFSITEGRRSIVSDLAIAGTDETSERLVREQFELTTGDALDLSLLAQSRRRLYRTGAFSIVDITRTEAEPANGLGTQLTQDNKPVDVDITVREVQPFQMRYGVSADTERGVGGVVDLSNHNSLGNARTLGFRGRYDGRLREARVYFGQPSLLYAPVETTASVYYTRERTPETALADAFNVVRRGATIQQERKLANAYVWTYGYRYERARKFGVLPGAETQETIVVSPLTSTFLRETRDDLLDATTGSFTAHAFSYSPTWLGGDTSYFRYYGQYFKYIPLQEPERKRFTNEIIRPRFVYAMGVRLGLAWSSTAVPLTERFYAGGSTTLRGFEQSSVGPIGPDGVPTGGHALLVLNNEVRVPLVGIVDGVGFLDIGNVFGRVRDFSFTDLRRTAGIGVRIRTPWFLIRGDYGIVLDLRPGERRSRFFFSLGQAF